MLTVTTIQQLRSALSEHKDRPTGFVPTMGALHKGHISLVERARSECGTVVVSIFVNPTQFNDPRDLERYPRTPASDIEMVSRAGADIVFLPSVEEIYPEPDKRFFDLGYLDEVMEGAERPGHFNGVAQIVSKLFEIVEPDRAYFGEKDFQQLAVIRTLTELMGYGIEIVPCPTVREDDGLAMSSRNVLLSAQARRSAPAIYAAMREGATLKSQLSPVEVEKYVTDKINETQSLRVIYFELVDARTFVKIKDWDTSEGIRGCVAVDADGIRLIDNIEF